MEVIEIEDLKSIINKLKEEDLFITKIGAFVSRFNLIFNHDCKIVKVKVYGD